jgi:hypothetical protein
MICCYCDRTLSCGGCGMEQPDNDEGHSIRENFLTQRLAERSAELFAAQEELARLKTEKPNDPAMDRQRRAQLEGLVIGMDQRGEKSAAHLIRLTVADLDALRKALYELLYVSFPPVGADTPDLVKKHHEAIGVGCELLGINPNGLL